MDELTAERYGWHIPHREKRPVARWWPPADWDAIAERRRILNEAMAPLRVSPQPVDNRVEEVA